MPSSKRAGTGIVGHHGDSGGQRPLDRLAEEVGVGHGERNAVRLGSHSLVDQLGRLFQVKLVGTQDRHIDVHVLGGLLDARFDRAPERVPGAQRVLYQNEVQHGIGTSFSHDGLDRYFYFFHDDPRDLDFYLFLHLIFGDHHLFLTLPLW